MPIQYQRDQVWPPCPFDTAAAEMAVHDAWYVGDPTALATAYTSGRAGTTPGKPGVWGKLRGWFWGTPPETVGKTTRLHVPVAADLATASADLLFSEPPAVTFPVADDAPATPAEPREGETPRAVRVKHPAQERLDDLMGSDQTHATLLEAAEVCAAIGGTFLRVAWDTDVVPDRPFLTAFGGDRAIPEFRYGVLTAVTFWTKYAGTSGSTVWRHLERHEPGFIYHALYEGTADRLGQPVPLTDRPETAGFAEVVNEDGAVETGATRLTAVYVPNVLPQRRWRKTPGLQHLGRSDFDGIESLFDALDEAWSSWMRDIHLGKARVFVDEGMLDVDAPGEGATFDTEREIFSPLAIGGSLKDGASIETFQPAIRYAEHQATVAGLVRQVLQSAGYSPSTLGLEGEGVATATEVTSRQRLSERTRDKKARYWSAALSELAVTMLEVDRFVFGGVPVDPHELPDVVFPETSQPDVEMMARTVQALRGVQAMSIETAVQTSHPDWDKPQVAEEVARILAEQKATAAPDPFTFRPFGAAPAAEPPVEVPAA